MGTQLHTVPSGTFTLKMVVASEFCPADKDRA